MKKSGNNQSSRNGVRSSQTKVSAPQNQNPFVMGDFDYSQYGRNSSQNYQAPAKRQQSTKSKSTSKRKPAKKKTSAGVKVATAVLGTVAVGVLVVGGLYMAGIIKPRLSVVLSDGTTSKITAEDAYTELTKDVFPEGIVIDGVNVSGKTKEEAKALVEQNQTATKVNPDISLDVNGQLHKVDLSSLTLTYNTDEIIEEAFNYSRPTSVEDVDNIVLCYNQIQQLKNAPKQYQTAYTADDNEISNVVNSVLAPLECEAKNASILGFNKDSNKFDIEPEVSGIKVNIDKASEDVKNMLDSRTYTGTVTVEASVTVPEVTTEFINQNYGKISSTSSVTSNNANRNHNISLACQKFDGYVMNPGDTFSFNGVVGQRSVANGFKEATVILGGQYEQGLGGGICQVSSMLYGSVVKANLKVDHRAGHAWPSTYCDVGTDATVDYGNIDFKFTNNTDYQIILRAYFNPNDSTVTCAIYGHYLENNMTIKFVGEEVSRNPSKSTEYVANPELKVGKTNTVRNAHDGIKAKSYQIWYDANGNEVSRNEVATTTYRTFAKKVEVGTLMEDGRHAALDTKTGAVTTPSPMPSPTPAPAPSSESTTAPAASSQETTAAPTTEAPTTAAPTTTTAAPTTEAPATDAEA